MVGGGAFVGVGGGLLFDFVGVCWNCGGNEIGGGPDGVEVGCGVSGPGDWLGLGDAFGSTVDVGFAVGVGVGVGGTYLPQGVIGGGFRPSFKAQSCNSGG